MSSELSINDAVERLSESLSKIGAKSVVVNTNVETKRDGLPRSGARKPDDPGVAIYFQLSGKPICMPCDTYLRVADNLAAVAAHIEATRAIERHGVASIAEMFTGFAQITAPNAVKPWWVVLNCRFDATVDVVQAQFRKLAQDRHPDRGGSHETMAELSEARDRAIEELTQ